MELHKTIQQTMWRYPSIAPSRISVLNHLFFTIGNGYEWVDGELVDTGDTPILDGPMSYKSQVDWSNNISPCKRLKEIFGEKTLKEEITQTKSRYIDDVQDSQYMHDFYPICEYSKINNIPDDIKIDWLEGAIEVCQWILSINPSDHIIAQRESYRRQIDGVGDDEIVNRLNEYKDQLRKKLVELIEMRERFFVDLTPEQLPEEP